MKIYAPVKDTNGVYASVRFVNGVGETDNPNLIEWFKTHGYVVENTQELREDAEENRNNLVTETQNDQIEVEDDEDEPVEMMGYADKSPNLESMNPNELRDWAKANGKGHLIKNTRNKEKLLEIIRG